MRQCTVAEACRLPAHLDLVVQLDELLGAIQDCRDRLAAESSVAIHLKLTIAILYPLILLLGFQCFSISASNVRAQVASSAGECRVVCSGPTVSESPSKTR